MTDTLIVSHGCSLFPVWKNGTNRVFVEWYRSTSPRDRFIHHLSTAVVVREWLTTRAGRGLRNQVVKKKFFFCAHRSRVFSHQSTMPKRKHSQIQQPEQLDPELKCLITGVLEMFLKQHSTEGAQHQQEALSGVATNDNTISSTGTNEQPTLLLSPGYSQCR